MEGVKKGLKNEKKELSKSEKETIKYLETLGLVKLKESEKARVEV